MDIGKKNTFFIKRKDDEISCRKCVSEAVVIVSIGQKLSEVE